MGTPSTGKRKHHEQEVEPLVVSPGMAAQKLNESRNRIYQRINSGELQSYKDGGARKITMASIRALVQRKLEASRNTAA